MVQIFGDIEIINLTECEKKVIDMNEVNNITEEVLRKYCTDEGNIKGNYRRYLNQLIQSNITNATFIKTKNPSKPEHIRSSDAQVEAFYMPMKKIENIF